MKVTRMTCEARIGNLEEVINFVDGCADRIGLTGIKKNKALIAVEEAFVNVCHYAYPGATGEVELTCRGKNDAFEFEIADNGIPFNMLSLPDPDTTADIMERKIGGLGVYLIRKLIDDVSYRRKDGQNILMMVLHTRK